MTERRRGRRRRTPIARASPQLSSRDRRVRKTSQASVNAWSTTEDLMSAPSSFEPAATPGEPGDEMRLVPSTLKFPVIGIGASAGGLEALLRFFEQVPAHAGMAFVVMLHLSPEHESNAAEILQRATRMPVQQVTRPTPLEADHVYVIPPGVDLTMNDGHLRPRQRDAHATGPQVAIDVFFRTLAQVHRNARSASCCRVPAATARSASRGSRSRAASPSRSCPTTPSTTACRARRSPPAWSTSCCRRPRWGSG